MYHIISILKTLYVGLKYYINETTVKLCSSQIEQQEKQEQIFPERSARLNLNH